MAKQSTLDKFKQHLFDDSSGLVLTASESEQLKRYRAIYSERLEDPSISNKSLVTFLQSNFQISQSQAYRDIGQMEQLFGNVVNAQKEWVRYLVVETLKESIALARDQADIKTMVKAATALGVLTRLDKEDSQTIPYEDIVPLQIEFQNDPSILGLPKVENTRETIDKVLRKYIDNVDFEEDAK